MPVARPKSLLTGENMKISWSANWDDNLGGSLETMQDDPILKKMSESVKAEFEKAFMFYPPPSSMPLRARRPHRSSGSVRR